jgi:hypothetical protein
MAIGTAFAYTLSQKKPLGWFQLWERWLELV